MSRFEPVKLPEGRELNGRASQTFLRYFNRCPRSAFFYQRTKGSGLTVPMLRGSAFHDVTERATNLMIEQGEPTIPGDLVKSIVADVVAEYALPFEEHDVLREMSYRWAGEWTVDPRQVVAVETLIVLQLGRWQVRCKVDFAEAESLGMVVRVADYKTARSVPGYEEIARKRPDGTLAAKNFQLILYALALAYGHPVRVDRAPCDCALLREQGRQPMGETCPACGDTKGYVEIIEPFPIAASAGRFDLEFVFPALEDREGRMVRRPVSLTQLELGEYRESLVALLDRVGRAEQTGDWPAVLSDEACSECPCRPECPIPAELRDHRGEINTLKQAAEAAEVHERTKAEQDALRKEIKAFAKGNEVEVRFGKNKAYRFVYSESERIDRKDEMFDAVERAREYGEPFERSRFVKVVGSSNFTAVTLSADELEEECNAAGSSDTSSAVV